MVSVLASIAASRDYVIARTLCCLRLLLRSPPMQLAAEVSTLLAYRALPKLVEQLYTLVGAAAGIFAGVRKALR